ncbi:MAG: filamentous hemagglutinin N-terminal domain-containing protein [Rubrivivax sp.]|nr:filamentous hemagglutinin N-terminal domain-containing protein [Rubrivivax sp.]
MATPRVTHHPRRVRTVSRLLAWLLAPFVGAFAFAQTAPAPNALPQGGQVKVGAGQLTQQGNLLLIQQLTPRLGLDWQSFNIGRDATVEFRQPGTSSIALNRVIGPEASSIFGRLVSNGQVFLSNPNGILFAPGAQVDVGSLVASTLDLSQDHFAAGQLVFSGAGGSVINQGSITAGGYVALFGADVGNEGEITVPAGSVVLASGRSATVSLSDSGLLSAVMVPGDPGSVLNSGRIAADGGSVRLSAESAQGLAASLVNNSGLVRANSIVERAGEIHITGDAVSNSGQLQADGRGGASAGRIVVRGGMASGSLDLAGSISAQALDAGGSGGQVETSAARVRIDDNTRVSTLAADGRHGQWLIDPTDFVVSAGGATQTESGIGASTLATNLQSGNVTLLTASSGSEAGDIRIEAPVSWTASTTLTLSAIADVEINANLTATGNAAGLTISAGSGRYTLADGVTVSLPGSSPSLSINGRAFVVINTLDELQGMGLNTTTRALSYALGASIDASATVDWNDGAGFAPVGNNSGAFSGDFEGLGHSITGLHINRPAESYVGLFGQVRNTTVSHLTLDGGSVTGGTYVGAVVGYGYGYNNGIYLGGLRQLSSSVAVDSALTNNTVYVGGLTGLWQYAAGFDGLQASGTVSSASLYGAVGGLAGRLDYASTGFRNSQASGDVTARRVANGSAGADVGGAFGEANNLSIDNVLATGSVGGGAYTGGLAGRLGSVALNNVTASGQVAGDGSYTGGLVGYASSGSVSNARADGDVVGQGYAGGLVGYAYYTPLQSALAQGAVSGEYSSGGLVGDASNSPMTDVRATGPVESRNGQAGGLVGDASQSTITRGQAEGEVRGQYRAGGLVGTADNSDINASSASGAVTLSDTSGGSAGGLVGEFGYGAITASSASGDVLVPQASYAGGLVGYAYGYSSASNGITDSTASGQVQAYSNAGGLVGYWYATGGGTLSNSHATGAVTAQSVAGGLVGNLYTYSYRGDGQPDFVINGVSASGAVQTQNIGGGLLGRWEGNNARLEDSHASGAVTAGSDSSYPNFQIGGLVGRLDSYTYYYSDTDPDAGLRIDRSFASGSVRATAVTGTYGYVYAGGLIGQVYATDYGYPGMQRAEVRDSYATGRVEVDVPDAYTAVGGLIGYLEGMDLTRTYSSGAVVATGALYSEVGGLVAQASNSTVTSSYWDTDTSGQPFSAAGTGLSTAQMRQAASFDGWDVSDAHDTGTTWRIYEGHTAPLLRSFLRPLTLTQGDASKAYDGSNSLAGTGTLDTIGDPITDLDRIFVAGAGPDAGSYGFNAAALYSSQLGYDLDVLHSGQTSTLDITPRSITLTGAVADKVYDGGTAASFVATPLLAGLVAGESLTLNFSGASASFDDRHVGTGKAVTVSGFQVADGANGRAANYSVGGTAEAAVTPKPITAGNFQAQDRVYDGGTAVVVGFTDAGGLSGVVGSDVVALNAGSASGTMADKHVGSAKPVAVGGVSLTGADAGNYTLAGIDAVTVNISPRPLDLLGLQAPDKVYNASTAVTVNSSAITLSGLLPGDLVLPDNDNLRGQMADKHVGTAKPVTLSGLALVGPDAANYTAQAAGLAVNVLPRDVYVYATTAYVNGQNVSYKVYDGSNEARATLVDYGYYLIGGDAVAITSTSTTFADKNVAYNGSGQVINKTITVGGIALTGDDASNYLLRTLTATTSGRIDPRPLAVSGVEAVDRVYDGTLNVVVNVAGAAVDLSNRVGSDDVAVQIPVEGAVVGTMLNKAVGTGKAVTVPGLTLTGTEALNYTLNAANGVTVDISPKDLTVVYTGVDRVYDRSTYATVTGASADIIGGDQVFFGASNCYGCSYFTGDGAKNVGTDKPVIVQSYYNYLYGSDANNYNLLNPGERAATADITARPITPSVSGISKVYDGTAVASVTLNTGASGIVSGDSVSLGTQNAVFTAGKNVGNGKAIAVSDITLSGTDAFNYSLAATTANTSANITAKLVNVTGIAAVDRVYDGTTIVAVQISNPTVEGLVALDDVQAVLPVDGISSGTMADRHVGTNKPVAVTGLSLSGSDAGNYTLGSSGGTVNITPKPISVAYTGVDKVYNRSDVATVTGVATGIVQGVGDSVGFTQSALFSGTDGRNVGTDKPIAVSNITLTGAQRDNYVLEATSASTSADITPKPITVAYIGIPRVYNGGDDLSAVVQPATNDLEPGDSVGFNQTARYASDGNAGSNKTINVTDISLAGVLAGNYLLGNTTATTSASITPRLLGVAGMAAVNRVYDGSTTVQVNVTGAAVDLTGVLGSDEVTVSLPPEGITTGSMVDKHVGQNKPVSVTGLLLGGSDAANYALTGADALTVDISTLGINVAFTGIDKEYDGSTTAQVLGTAIGFNTGDSLGVSANAVFTGAGARNVGDEKAVAVSNALLTGADRFNYVLLNRDGSTTASITPRSVTPVYTGGTRAYDGGVAAPVNVVLSRLVGGDAVSVAQSAVFTGDDAKNVGSAKPVAVSDVQLAGADAGNYVLSTTSGSTTASITPRLIVVEGVSGLLATPRVYDGTTLVQVTVPEGITGTPREGDVLAGEQVLVQVPAPGTTTGTMADKHAGTAKPVQVAGLGLSGTDAGNYAIASATGVTVDISRLGISAFYNGLDKVYDGSTAAQVQVRLDDALAGDVLTGSATGVFTAGKNVGQNLAVAVSGGALAGADARNYTLLNPTGATGANITPRSVTAVYTGGSKVYDGSSTAPVTGSVNGLVSGDSVALDQTAVFSGGKNAGDNKAIAVSAITLAGTDGGNYQLNNTTAVASGNVTSRPVVVEGLSISAEDRVYDGSTQVVVQVQATEGAGVRAGDLIDGDQVTVNLPGTGQTTGTMTDKNAGLGKTLTLTELSLSGTDAINYRIVGADGLTVDISPRTLSATWTGVDKVYDGTATASATGSATGIVAGDALSLSASGVFTAGKNVGSGLAIELQSLLLAGADAGNYGLDSSTGNATANITPRTLQVAYTGGSRAYDGSTAAPVQGTLGGLIGGDAVTLGQSAVFSGGKNVGDNKAISVTDIALGGADAGNYRSDIAATNTTGSITPREIVIDGLSATAVSRVYDGTTAVAVDLIAAAGVAPRAGDLIAGDDVTVNVPDTGQTVGTMADKRVGTGKAVVISGLGLSGADADNYRIVGVDGVTVDITPRMLTAVWTGVDKVYDGTATANATGAASGIVTGDALSLAASGLFDAGKNVGNGLAITLNSTLLIGADAGNYALDNPTGTTTASILPKTVAAVYAGVDKVYDGGTAAQVTGQIDGLVAGDALSLSQSAVFSSGKNAGADKPVLVAGIALDGADAGNYRLATTETSTMASITPRPLDITGLSGLAAVARTYDGTRNVQLTGSAQGQGGLQGVLGNDDVQLAQGDSAPTSGTLADKNAGLAKAVVVDGLGLSGADAGNYLLGGVVGLTVDIAPLPVALSGLLAVNRVYDGTRTVAINTAAGSIAGVLAGDDLQLLASGVTGSMADKAAGTAKAVALDGVAFAGTDASNYTVQVSGLQVDIAPRLLTVVGTAQAKVYDGSVAAAVAYTDDRVADDQLGIGQTAAQFADKNAGTAKVVNVSGLGLSGADAANYVLAGDALTLAADITPRPVTVTAGDASKVYGSTVPVPALGFALAGSLADGERIDGVTLSPGGLAAADNVGTYAITARDAQGAGFDPANYALTYVDGRLTVTPRPLTIASQTVLRYAGDANPVPWGFSSAEGGLVNGDTLLSVQQPAAPGAEAGVGLYTLAPPAAAQFGSGLAANYDIRYESGRLIVLPRPPQVDDEDGGTTGGGGQEFVLDSVPPEQVAAAAQALRRSAAAVRAAALVAPTGPDPRATGNDDPAEVLAAVLRGETRRITLATLLRLPMLSIDPQLQRLLDGGALPQPSR